MATHKSAIKRIKTSHKQRDRNRRWRSRLRTMMKKVRNAQTPDEAQAALTAAIPIIDRTANRGVIHRNAAARYKSRLHHLVETKENLPL